jgi:hypothetical protein
MPANEAPLLTQAEKDHFKQHGLDVLQGELALQDLKQFACSALTGLLAAPGGVNTPEGFAAQAFRIGFAMLKELHTKQTESSPKG